MIIRSVIRSQQLRVIPSDLPPRLNGTNPICSCRSFSQLTSSNRCLLTTRPTQIIPTTTTTTSTSATAAANVFITTTTKSTPSTLRFYANRYAKTIPLAPPITNKTRLTEYPFDEEIEYDIIHFIDENGKTQGIVPLSQALESFNRATYILVFLNEAAVRAAEEKALLAAEGGETDNTTKGSEGGEVEGGGGGGGEKEVVKKVMPICKLMAKSELRLELTKKREQLLKKTVKQPEQTIKELQIGWAISENDLRHRVKRMKEFLEKGNKVEIMIAPKKRMAGVGPDRPAEVLAAFREAAEEVGATEVKMEGIPGGRVMLYFQGSTQDNSEGGGERQKKGGSSEKKSGTGREGREEKARKRKERMEKKAAKAAEAAREAEAAGYGNDF